MIVCLTASGKVGCLLQSAPGGQFSFHPTYFQPVLCSGVQENWYRTYSNLPFQPRLHICPEIVFTGNTNLSLQFCLLS